MVLFARAGGPPAQSVPIPTNIKLFTQRRFARPSSHRKVLNFALTMPRRSKRTTKTAWQARKKAKCVTKSPEEMQAVFKKMTMTAIRRTLSPEECRELWKDLEGTGLQDDKDVLRRAIYEGFDASRLESPLWDDKDFTLDLFLEYARDATKEIARAIWSHIKSKWQEDARISFPAVNLGICRFEKLPDRLKTKRVVLKAIRENRLDWCDLSTDRKRDVDYLVASPKPSDFSYGMDTVEDKSKLWEWVKANAGYCCIPKEYWTTSHVPLSATTNAGLLLEIIRKSAHAMHCVDKSLCTEEFLTQALQINPLVLGFLPWKIEGHLADVVWNRDTLLAFAKAGGVLRLIRESVPAKQWRIPEFLRAWARGGGSLMFLGRLIDDEEVFLEFARRHPNKDGAIIEGFAFMGDELKTSVPFCRRLLDETHAGNCFDFFDDSVTERFDIKLQAYSKSLDFREYNGFRLSPPLKSALNDFKGFFYAVLCSSKREGSPMRRLDDLAKRTIGSFLGVPVGPNFFQAAANLDVLDFPPFATEESYKFTNESGMSIFISNYDSSDEE